MHMKSRFRLKLDRAIKLDSVRLDLSGEREVLGPMRLGVFPIFILSEFERGYFLCRGGGFWCRC